MIKKDLIYQDKDYSIVKHGVDDNGHFEPTTWFDILFIAIQPLKQWENGGLKHKSDYEELINKVCAELKSTISE